MERIVFKMLISKKPKRKKSVELSWKLLPMFQIVNRFDVSGRFDLLCI